MIGTHTVVVLPDPLTPIWSAPLASNPDMTANIAGWGPAIFADTVWQWAAPGVAKYVSHTTGALLLGRLDTAPVPRDLSAKYRVRVRGVIDGNGWLIPEVTFGTTATAAYVGPFWDPDNAIGRGGPWFRFDGPTDYVIEAVYNADDVPATFGFLAPKISWIGDGAVPVNLRSLTVDSFELAGQIVAGADISCLVDTVAIIHGRDDSNGQPNASTATLDLSFDTAEDELPASVEIGALVRVATDVGGVDSVRFTGAITDVLIGWDEAGADTPNAAVVQVIAAGPLAALGSRVVGAAPFPQQLDGARVAAVLAAAGTVLDPTTSDPGMVQILARDIDSQPALAVAQEVAESAGGTVWETRSGYVRYADSEHRRNITPSLTLDACDVLVTPTWRRDTAGLVNSVSIGYGEVPEGEEQARYVASNPASQARYGFHEITSTTVLAALADAQAMGQLLLVRNVSPVWLLSELPVDVAGLDPDRTAALLGLDMHDLIGITGLPVLGSLPSTTSLWVEGWSETLTHGGHDYALFVSGYCRTSPPPRWDDLSPAITWDTVSAALTWDGAACLGPLPSLGRWDDVAASLRWDTVPAATTWDTWKG